MTMSTSTGIEEARTSPMNRDFRLSPRCIIEANSLTANGGGYNNDLSVPSIPRRFPKICHSPEERTAYRDIYNGKDNNTLEVTDSFTVEHGRQNSILSSTSNEISQYLCHNQGKNVYSRPHSLLDSPLSANSWSFHSRQSSLEGITMGRKSSGRKIMTPSPLNRPPPPPYSTTLFENSVIPKQISPSSIDLGYNTMVNNSHSNNNHSKCGYETNSPVLDKKVTLSSTPKRTLLSGRSKSNLAKSWLHKELSLLPTKHNMLPSFGASNTNICGGSNLANHDSERVHMNLTTETVIYNGNETKRNISSLSPFDKLSNELILKIFSNLCATDICVSAKVCRRFYFLAWEPNLWKTIKLDGQSPKYLNADHALKSLLNVLCRDPVSSMFISQNVSFKQASLVERISISSCSTLSDVGLFNISERCPELRRLELQNCKEITNSGIQSIATLCTSLDYMDLTGCPLVSTIKFEVPEPTPATAALGGVPPAPSRSLYLRYLDLTDCTRLMDAGLHIIVKHSPHLHQLFLRRCVNITDIGVKYIASYCLGLRELSMSDCIQVTDFGLYELAKLGPNLRYLSVAKCEQISDSGIQQLARLCYKLRYLNVRGCESISDNALNILTRSCMRLKSLDIGKCDVTDLGLKLLGEFSTSLRKLSVKSCEMITDEGIKYIAYHCKGLQHINIQDCPITVEGYRTLKKFCKKCIIEHTNPGFY